MSLEAFAEDFSAIGDIAERVPEIGTVLYDYQKHYYYGLFYRDRKDQCQHNRRKHNDGTVSPLLVEHRFQLLQRPTQEERTIEQNRIDDTLFKEHIHIMEKDKQLSLN